MKKRLFWFLAGLILLMLCVLAFSWNVLFPAALSRELATLVPPEPLIFLHGSQLRAHVEHFVQRPKYETLLNSEFLAGLNQTEWWPDFRENFRAFWTSLIIDPMHIVGHEMAFAMYAGEVGEALPRAILIGKTDQVARIAERLMYGYERLTHQIGITFHQTYQRRTVYALQTPDMLWPLYYAVAGEAALISTSLPLLYNTIDVIDAQPQKPQSRLAQANRIPTVFTQAYPAKVADNQVLSGYIDSEGFSLECVRNPLLRALGLGQQYTPGQYSPYAAFVVTADSGQLVTRIRWFSAEHAATLDLESLKQIRNWDGVLPQSPAQPLLLVGNLPRMQEFLRVGERLFPQWPRFNADVEHGVYGEHFECSLSDRLVGLLYTLPEIACLVDTVQPAESQRTLNHLVQSMLLAPLPPLVQKRMATTTEPYQDTEIASVELKMSFLKQNIVNYAAASTDTAGYTTVSNSIPTLKRHLDTLAVDAATAPYQFDSTLFHAGFLAVLSPEQIAGVLENLSQTSTFAFVVPPHNQQLVQEALPLIVHGLRLLPIMTATGEALDNQLVVDIRMHP